MSDLIEALPWDSDFFGFPIARLRTMPETEAELADVEEACRAASTRCLYALVPAARPDAIQRMTARGYRWVDIRLTLRCTRLNEAADRDARVRPARPDDIPALREIAAVSHDDSRFFADPGFLRERCAEFYATWIQNSVGGFEDAVWVGEHEGRAAGYVTCKLRGEGRGQIGLFAVSDAARGRGIGRDLLQAALGWFSGRNCTVVDVVTQGCNIEAQRIYQRNGFVTHSVEVWLHKWF